MPHHSHAIGTAARPIWSDLPWAAGCRAFSTDSVSPRERIDYWRATALRRMEPEFAPSRGKPFEARLIHLPGEGVEMVRHAADAVVMNRTRQQCRRDGCDDISLGFILAGTSLHPERGSTPLRPGEIHVLDCAEPVKMRLSRHVTMSLVLRRPVLRELLGRDPAAAGYLRLPRTGIAGLLRSHMQATFRQAARLSPEQRALALRVGAELAGAAIQAALETRVDPDRMPLGLRHAALAEIARSCTDPELTPARLAAALGCSRAALYRLFAEDEASVSALIWTARLEHAHDLLVSADQAGVPIGEIAFRSGFLDHPSFNRMFKRRYGLTPREARLVAHRPAERAHMRENTASSTM